MTKRSHDAPPGSVTFPEATSGRDMLLTDGGGNVAGWLYYRGRRGEWVPLREATPDDVRAVYGGLTSDYFHELALE